MPELLDRETDVNFNEAMEAWQQEQSAPVDEDAGHEKTSEPAKKPGDDAGQPSRRRYFVYALIALAVIGAAIAGTIWWLNARHYEWTDDAFISARNYSISPQVAGNIVAVPVTDNEDVAAGTPLVRIDDRSYRASVMQAKAQVRQAEAGIANAAAQIVAQQAQIDQGAAQLKVASAALEFSKQQHSRYQTLAKSGYGTIETAQQWQSDLGQKQANLSASQAGLEVARKHLAVLEAQKVSAEASLDSANAGLAQAEISLANTTITAAVAGRVAQISAGKGDYAPVGQALMMFIPDKIWIVANFKETQITDMRPGQPVDIRIDAYPATTFKGHIDSIQPGSGAAFSLLPAENATGNYVKVTQRVPVKILLDGIPANVVLGPGMSVVPEVRVR